MNADINPVGYWPLIRDNRNFRRLWAADVVSLFGDWFNAIAIYALVATVSDSPAAIGFVFIAKLVPAVVLAPFAGLLVDRLDRRWLMIVADLTRAFVVLGFLLVEADTWVGWIYALAVLQVALGTVFTPARSAATPNVCSDRELATANTLSSVTWSVMLTVGAGFGGVATDALGTDAIFIIDSLSYLVSAWFILRTVIPQSTDRSSGPPSARVVITGVGEGIRYMGRSPEVTRIAFAKALWSLGVGPIYFMFVVLSPSLMPQAPSTATGLLYAAAGLGTGIGPVLVRALVQERLWAFCLGPFLIFGGLVYLGFSILPWMLAGLVFVTVAHCAGGANWVISTVLMQRRTEDRFRGRVFSVELLILNVMNALSIGVASLILHYGWLDIREAISAFAAWQVLLGVGYFLVIWRGESLSLVHFGGRQP